MTASMRIRSVCAGLAALGMIAMSGAALAAHGKAGLWEISVKMEMAGMPQIPPEQLAKMRQMGMQMPMGQTITAQHCMTAAEVASDMPPSTGHEHRGCSMQNTKLSGHNFDGDMVCKGDTEGQGHLRVSYDSDEHYVGQMTFNGVTHGHPGSFTNSFEGHWVSASCGSVTH